MAGVPAVDEARELDLLGARAWPPLEREEIGAWQLRFSHGVTARANSVLPLGPDDGPPLDARIDAVERAYAKRGLTPRFQLTASSWPPGLAAELRGLGYVDASPTVVMTRPAGGLEARREWEVAVRDEVSDDWLAAWWEVDGRGGPAELEVARGILARIEPRRRFVEARDGEGVAGVGLGVVDGDWVGVYCMATLPRARRLGCATAVLAALLGDGSRRAHLSVLAANSSAQALYRGVGFDERQRYVYLVR